MSISYDPKCEELARFFLQAESMTNESEVTELAGVIQQAIEDWWAARNPGGET